jgi:imidazolonepropionase-like amidohydrolase
MPGRPQAIGDVLGHVLGDLEEHRDAPGSSATPSRATGSTSVFDLSSPWANTRPEDEPILAELRERCVALTPTLALWKSFARHDRLSTQESITSTAVGQLRAWVSRGGAVLFGTDLGAVDPDPREEYALMTAAGMDFRQILAALTTAPARRFTGSESAGRIAAGSPADLVVLNGDPTRNPEALADVCYTIRSGKIVYRAAE